MNLWWNILRWSSPSTNVMFFLWFRHVPSVRPFLLWCFSQVTGGFHGWYMIDYLPFCILPLLGDLTISLWQLGTCLSLLIACIYPTTVVLSLYIRKNSMIDHAWSLFRNYFRMEHNKCAMTFKQMYPSLYWLVYSGPHHRLWVLPTNKPGRIPSGNQMWQWKIPCHRWCSHNL
jgi:hypothetical protein